MTLKAGQAELLPVSSGRGFTLMELIIVVVIIGIVVGIALPAFNRIFLKTQLNAAIRDVAETLVYAHQCAVSEGVSCQVNFDLNSQRYWLSQGKKPLSSLKPRTLGGGVTMTEVVIAQADKTGRLQNHITFKPDGTVDKCLLYLEDKKGNVYTIVTMKTTGQVRTFNYKYELTDDR